MELCACTKAQEALDKPRAVCQRRTHEDVAGEGPRRIPLSPHTFDTAFGFYHKYEISNTGFDKYK